MSLAMSRKLAGLYLIKSE